MAVALITGATDGIGRVTAEQLARRGYTTVIAGRNAEKTARVAAEISAAAGAPVDTLLGDLSVQADVRRIASEFKARHERLDVLVNNAGALFFKRQESADGIEMTWALNHLSYFLLTHELLDLLIASGSRAEPSRIVNVSSMAHSTAQMDFDDPERHHSYSGMGAYGQSKLGNVLFTYELARWLREADAPVTVNALHPGVVASQFAANNGRIGQIIRRVMKPFSISIEEGAQTSIYLATSPQVRDVSGNYFDKCTSIASSQISYSHAVARRLWQLSEQQVGLAS